MSRNLIPTFVGNHSSPGRTHLALDNLSKQEFAFMRADCNVIPPCAGVIVPLQTDGTAVMFFGGGFPFSRRGASPAGPLGFTRAPPPTSTRVSPPPRPPTP